MTQQTIDHLIAVIGHQPTLELVRGWGGRRVYVPQTPKEQSPLALRIGDEAASALSGHYGGETLELPAARNVLIRLRDQSIVAALDAGTSLRDVATEHGLSPRHVRHIRDVQSRRE